MVSERILLEDPELYSEAMDELDRLDSEATRAGVRPVSEEVFEAIAHALLAARTRGAERREQLRSAAERRRMEALTR